MDSEWEEDSGGGDERRQAERKEEPPDQTSRSREDTAPTDDRKLSVVGSEVRLCLVIPFSCRTLRAVKAL